MAFADSFDSLQGARERIAERNVDNDLAYRALDDRESNDDQAFAMQQADFLARLRNARVAQAMAQRQQDFYEGASDRAAGMDKARLDLQSRAQDFAETAGNPAAIRDSEFMLRAASDAAQRGEFGSIDDVRQFAPTISEGQAQVLADQSNEVRKHQAGTYLAAKQMADVLNNHRVASENASIALEGNGFLGSPLGRSPYYDPQAAAEFQRQADALAERVGKIKARKDIDQYITQDEDGNYAPVMPEPRGFRDAVAQANKTSASQPAAASKSGSVQTPKVVVQGGNRFLLYPDGSSTYIGPASAAR